MVKVLMQHKRRVSFSPKPDFSDYVDQFGQSHPRQAVPPAPPTDRYAPFMPDVDLPRHAHEVFATALTAASTAPEGHGVALLRGDPALKPLPAPPPQPAPP